MSWIWQKQSGGLSNKIKRKTDWKSPNIVSQCLPNSREIVPSKKTDPIDPTELNGATGRTQDFYIVSNSDIPPHKSLWNDLDNIKTVTDDRFDYATLLSINTLNTNVTNMSPLISCRDFDFGVPTGSTITGVEIKITKSAYSESAALSSPINCDDSIYFVSDLFTNKITNYTYDDVVTISLSSDCNSTFYNDSYYITERDNFNNTSVDELTDLVPQYSFLSPYKNYANPWISDKWYTNIISDNDYYNYFGFNPTPIINYFDVTNNITYSIVPPKGVWSETKQSYIYGGEDELWGDESLTLTPESVNVQDFGMYFKCNQKIPRSYSGSYLNTTLFGNDRDRVEWYNFILQESPYDSCIGYEVSKLHDIQIRIHYELDSEVLTLDGRENIFNSGNTLTTYDTYFKFQRCFNGICYQYVSDIYDIYKISLMSGDGISINNMYNEYNVIDEYCSNIYRVDVATKEQIDLTDDYFLIDNIKMKPGHKVLLLDQQSASTNDIYVVDENYFLVNSNLLSTRESAYRTKVSVKMGTYAQEQYFLNDFGNQFPITGETKMFTTGHSYMVKNYIDYNIKNTETGYTYDVSGNTIGNPNKIVFTNYKVARTLSELKDWNDIEFTPTSAMTIKYLDTEYTLTSEYDLVFYDKSGSTTNETYFNWSGLSYFSIDTDFYSYSSVGDHAIISYKKNADAFSDDEIISTNSDFNYLSKIRYIDSDYVAFDEIPTYMINDILTGSTAYTFRVRNLQFCSGTTDSYEEYMRYSPYGDILNFRKISGLNIKPYDTQQPNKSDNYRWFDYNLLTVNNIVDGETTAYTFTTSNQYQNYNLKSFLDILGTTPEIVYNSSYYLSGEYYIEEIWEDTAYNRDGSFHSSGGTNSTYYSRQSSRWKIIPYDTTKLSEFRPYTYIDYGVLTSGDTGIVTPYSFIDGDTGRTLIVEVTDEYMIVEKPRLEHDPASSYYDPTTNLLHGLTYDIINVSKTQDISDILYELYLSYAHSYYYYYSDSFYNRICSTYAIILKENRVIRNMTTGILYQKNDLFNFDIFNINIDDDFKHLDDVNLTFQPIELIDIGIDGKTKLPIPLEIDNINIKNTVFPYFTGRTEGAYTPASENLSYLRTSVMVNDKLYYQIQYQGKLFFNGEETSDDTYLKKYYTQNNATLMFDDELSETGLSYYYFMFTGSTYNTDSVGFFNNQIKTDISGNTYHLGVSRHTTDTWISTDTYFDISNSINTLSDSILRKGTTKTKDIGYLIKYDSDGSINTSITYSGNERRLTYTNDVETINNTNYVYISINGNNSTVSNIIDKVYQSVNNGARTLLYQVTGATGHGKNTSSIIKYSDEFSVVNWKLLFSSLSTTGELLNTLSVEKSLKIVKDSDEEYIYNTISTGVGTNKLKIDKLSSSGYTYFYQYDDITHNSFSIIKNTIDGVFVWLKPIYYPDYSGSTQTPELTNIIYEEDNLYISINSNTEIIIGDITYGENNIGIKHYVIKIDKDGNVIWVNILGKTNNTIGTDIKIHNKTTDKKYLYTSGYFTKTTKISNFNLVSNGEISSYITKIDANTGDIVGVFDKHSTDKIKIKTIDIVDDNIYIGGDWIGGTFLGGTRQENYLTTTYSRVFVEQIKINSF